MDAVLIYPSMPSVMKLTILGTFSLSGLGQKKSIFYDFVQKTKKNSGGNVKESLFLRIIIIYFYILSF